MSRSVVRATVRAVEKPTDISVGKTDRLLAFLANNSNYSNYEVVVSNDFVVRGAWSKDRAWPPRRGTAPSLPKICLRTGPNPVTPGQWYVSAFAHPAAWITRVNQRVPRALKSDRVFGRGNFALMSCWYADGVRRVTFFDTEEERASFAERYATCEAPQCTGNHQQFHLLDRLCAHCEKPFIPQGGEIFCTHRCKRRDDKEGPR